MEKKQFLMLSKQCNTNWCANSIIFSGEMTEDRQFKFTGTPGFIDALKQLQPSLQHDASSYKTLSFTGTIHEPFYFQDQRVKINLQPTMLTLLDENGRLSEETAYDIFQHFLIKRKNRISFITDSTRRKITKAEKGQNSDFSDEKECEKG